MTIGEGNVYENHPGYWEERIIESNTVKSEEIKKILNINDVPEKTNPQLYFQNYQLDNSTAIRLSLSRLGIPPVEKSFRKIKVELKNDISGRVRM